MKRTLVAPVGFLVLASACSGGGDLTQLNGIDPAFDEAAQAELALGAEGPEVASASKFFSNRGYFENEQLRAEYPSWRPVIGAPPAAPHVFGPELEAAVKAFQQSSGLEVTGVIDAATRAEMLTPRCGVPDSEGGSALPSLDTLDTDGLTEKWAVKDPTVWQPDSHVTIYVSNPPDSFVDGNGDPWNERKGILDAYIVGAFSAWGRVLGQTLTHTSKASALSFEIVSTAAAADVDVYFCNNTSGNCSGFDFSALASANSTRLRFNAGSLIDDEGEFVRDMVWDDGTTSVGSDLISVTIHEAGHVIGLTHSSVVNGATRPQMYPSIGVGVKNTILHPDDYQALAVSPYTNWDGVPGTLDDTRDIGASNTSASGRPETVWKVGNTTVAGEGYSIHRWQESSGTWTGAIGGGAVRIDVNQNIPWIVTSAGLARARTGVSTLQPNGTGWDNRGDCNFIDIGASSNNVIWALGGTADADGDFDVYRYNGATNTTACTGWTLVNDDVGDGIRIDVSPADGSPWVVAANGSIFHRNGVAGGTPTGSSWSQYGGKAADISVGPDVFGPYGAVWIVGHASQTDDSFLLNRQSSQSGVESRNGWFRAVNPGNAFSITAGRNGYPWVVGGSRSAWRRSSVF